MCGMIRKTYSVYYLGNVCHCFPSHRNTSYGRSIRNDEIIVLIFIDNIRYFSTYTSIIIDILIDLGNVLPLLSITSQHLIWAEHSER